MYDVKAIKQFQNVRKEIELLKAATQYRLCIFLQIRFSNVMIRTYIHETDF